MKRSVPPYFIEDGDLCAERAGYHFHGISVTIFVNFFCKSSICSNPGK